MKVPFLDVKAAYAELSGEIDAAVARNALALPPLPNRAEPVWQLYVVPCDARDKLQQDLGQAGVATQFQYPIPAHLQQAYLGEAAGFGNLSRTERMAGRNLSLPIGPHLTEAQAGHVTARSPAGPRIRRGIELPQLGARVRHWLWLRDRSAADPIDPGALGDVPVPAGFPRASQQIGDSIVTFARSTVSLANGLPGRRT